MASDLTALRDILSSSIDNIVGVCNKTGKDFPSLDEPAHPSEFSSDGIRNHPEVAENIALAVAAASQLIAALQSPLTSLMVSAYRYTLPVSLGIAEATNVAEIIRDSGPKGMHVEEIAKRAGVDARKLERALRFLATNHWFREVKERTFAHNLLSSLLDTGKDLTEDFADTKHHNTRGFAAIAAFGADESILSAAGLKQAMLNPKTAFSDEVNDSGFQWAYKTDLSLWQYYDLPENKRLRDRFNIVMSSANTINPELIHLGYNWEDVQDGILVDVAGGTGHVSLEVARKFPNIRIVVEDRKTVVEEAKHYWNKHLPSHVSEGKVHFIETDIFGDQPTLPGAPDIFLLRWILHDWSDKNAIKILKKLRKAAIPGKTKLLIVESIIDYACESKNSQIKQSGPAASKAPPPPLLPNLGGANLLPYIIEINVLSLVNSLERTIPEFVEIIEASGWKFSHVQSLSGSKMFWPIVAVPDPDYSPSDWFDRY